METIESPERLIKLKGPGVGPVKRPKKQTDQTSVTVFMQDAAAAHEPVKAPLPLFMETLFKAREFDPL
ncbi:hypothetical protein [Paraflavitalea soli]|nr:hypothetical protein [Paraflavitalea soli]